MTRLVLFLTFVALALLFVVSQAAPTNSAVWLASTSQAFAYFRLAMMVVIATLLVTHPPRNVIFRSLVGFMAVGLTVWCLTATYQNNMGILDTFAILATSIATGITVLEYKPDPIDRYANYEIR